jgi:hypothetical protein
VQKDIARASPIIFHYTELHLLMSALATCYRSSHIGFRRHAFFILTYMLKESAYVALFRAAIRLPERGIGFALRIRKTVGTRK